MSKLTTTWQLGYDKITLHIYYIRNKTWNEIKYVAFFYHKNYIFYYCIKLRKIISKTRLRRQKLNRKRPWRLCQQKTVSRAGKALGKVRFIGGVLFLKKELRILYFIKQTQQYLID